MQYVDNEGVRIHYRTIGIGPPLVLQHWSLATLEDWYDHGYVEGLKNDYRLILLDARGHGDSGKPYNSQAYKLKNRVKDIVAVLDELKIAQSHFLGYSMGGWIGFGVARYAPERFHSLIIGGSHPYAQCMEGLREIVQCGIEKGPETSISMWEKIHGRISSKERMLTYDYTALLAVAQDRDSMEDFLSEIEIPCLLYVGEKDEGVLSLAKQCAAQLDNVKLVTIPGLNHGETIVRSDKCLPHIKQFLSEVKQQGVA